MASFERDGIKFHHAHKGTGTPFIFQHGLGGETAVLFAPLHPPPGFRLVGMDCRAHGLTRPVGDPAKISFHDFADDLIALLDHLGIERTVLGGVSMGAGVALNCALRFPGRCCGLVLLRPAWLDRPREPEPGVFGFVARCIREHGAAAGAEVFRQSEMFAGLREESPEMATALLLLFIHPRAVETVVKLERIPRDAPTRDAAGWRRLKVPTLIMATRKDPIHPFEYAETLAREIPGAEFTELTTKSASPARYTAELNRRLAEFFARHFENLAQH